MQTVDNNQISFMKKPVEGSDIKLHVLGKVQTVQVLKVHPFGTLDIMTAAGNCYRVSGLSFL